jgi:hypothetical protein
MGVGDCGGLRFIPGATQAGKQRTPDWLANLLGIPQPEPSIKAGVQGAQPDVDIAEKEDEQFAQEVEEQISEEVTMELQESEGGRQGVLQEATEEPGPAQDPLVASEGTDPPGSAEDSDRPNLADAPTDATSD